VGASPYLFTKLGGHAMMSKISDFKYVREGPWAQFYIPGNLFSHKWYFLSPTVFAKERERPPLSVDTAKEYLPSIACQHTI
jgi:hypothetical protein